MAIDFKRLFNDFKIPMRNERKQWIQINCPFCTNPRDTHFNGGFSVYSPAFYCWRCGKHNYLDGLSKVLNISISSAKNLIKDYSFISKEVERKIPQGHDLSLPGYALNPNERNYLINRGYDPDYLMSKYGIRGGGIAGDWAYRILVPIYYNHVLVSWTGRSILSREQIDQYKIPRYKNLDIEQSVINAKSIFFNLDNCLKKEVILVEGPFDVLKMGDDTICSLGTSVTNEQALFLKNRFNKIFIAFDNEPAAQDKARKLGFNLSSVGLSVEVVNICEDYNNTIYDKTTGKQIKVPKNDPGELTEDEVFNIKKELNI